MCAHVGTKSAATAVRRNRRTGCSYSKSNTVVCTHGTNIPRGIGRRIEALLWHTQYIKRWCVYPVFASTKSCGWPVAEVSNEAKAGAAGCVGSKDVLQRLVSSSASWSLA